MRSLPKATPVCLLLMSFPAAAAGLSTDVEIFRPTFSAGGLPAIDSPDVEKGTLRVGTFYQWQDDPLVYYLYENYVGALLDTRHAFDLGVSYDFTDSISARFVLPGASQVADELPAESLGFNGLDADGFGVGDPNIGVRVEVAQVGPLTLGVRSDLYLPFGSDEMYLGEDGVRAGLGLLMKADINRVALLMDANLTGRQSVDTGQDFILGSELSVTPGVHVSAIPEKLGINSALVVRSGLANMAQGGAENSMEALAGLQFWPEDWLQVDLGYGKGITDGYGATVNRVYGGVTWIQTPPPKSPPEIVVDVEPPPQVSLIELEPEEEEPVWEEGQLAKVEQERIIIRDPIQFQVDTAIILEPSLPTLSFVADLLNANGQIAHIVIEGHASEEGDYDHNYALSVKRSRSIWEQLILNGVAPSRMSYRGMGEVVPVEIGEDEKILAKSRRVVFHIIKQLDALEELPDYELAIDLPWSGVPHKLKKPTQAMPEEILLQLREAEEREKNRIDPKMFLETEEGSSAGGGSEAPAEEPPAEGSEEAEAPSQPEGETAE